MNTQVNTFPDRVRIKADLARFAVRQLSEDSNQGVITTSRRAPIWADASIHEDLPTCVIVGQSTPKRLHLVNEVTDKVVKKVDLPGPVLHVAMHENFVSNGQILVVYEDDHNVFKLKSCILKYDLSKNSLRRYPDIVNDVSKAGHVYYLDPATKEQKKSSVLDAQDVFAMSNRIMGDASITPEEFFETEVKFFTRTHAEFSFRSWAGADEGSVTSQNVVSRHMSNMRVIQFFEHKNPNLIHKFLQLSDMNLPSRYRRGTCMLSSSDSARFNSKFIHTSLKSLLDVNINQNYVSLLLRGRDNENKITKEAYGFFPYRNPSIRYSEYNLEKAIMLFKLPDDTSSLSCNRDKVYVAVSNEVRVYDNFQRLYTDSVSANKGVISDDKRKVTVKSLLPTDESTVGYFSSSWESLLSNNYVGSFDDASQIDLGAPSSIYTFDNENVVDVKAHGSGPFDLMCVHTIKSGDTTENRKHKADTLYVYLAGRLVFKKSFSNGISSFKPYIVSVADTGERENCFSGTSVKEICIDISLDEKTFLSFDVFPERSSVTVRDMHIEQIQTRTVSAPQLSRFIDF